ncbi:hypothetical protein [Lactococcus formosensis]|uniref:hypothetical protein n=1 Tax=Lactococcus formosensis TaxID=1281486 RepID=UPI0002DBC2D4|nr:hypothetical protein [Lactococcus formosensis]MDG6113850.1 hypothetical protein [Lactococcus formosensis]MDG6115831.1 hypothetical protein [Lactococcus formosensis]MDG6122159.1 hypothetical protein [Lactococcus formosensis]MDG6123682.1 hypothetical protein [Lactococcus formosensis]MDG6128610.1 hypothetical protein [Lactococcus formosensis]
MKKKRIYFSVAVIILLLANTTSGAVQVIAEELSKNNRSVEKIESPEVFEDGKSESIIASEDTERIQKRDEKQTSYLYSENEYPQEFVEKNNQIKFFENNKGVLLPEDGRTDSPGEKQHLKLQEKNIIPYLSTQWTDVPTSFRADIAQMLLKHNDEILNRFQTQINQSNEKLGWKKGSKLILDIPQLEVEEYGPGRYTYIKGIVKILTNGFKTVTDGTIKVGTTNGGNQLYIERVQNKPSQKNIEIEETYLGLEDRPTNEIGYYNPWYLEIDGVVDTIDYGKKILDFSNILQTPFISYITTTPSSVEINSKIPDPSSYISITQSLTDSPQFKYLQEPDFSRVGTTEAIIQITDRLEDYSVEEIVHLNYTVTEDKTTLDLQDVNMYVGQTFDPNMPFKNVADMDGNKLTAADITKYTIDGIQTKTIDTSLPGQHRVKIYHENAHGVEIESNEALVNVNQDQTELELKNVDLEVGDIFDPDAPFQKVVDKDGNLLSSKDIQNYQIDGKNTKELDTSIPGQHTVQIAYANALGQEVVSNEAVITVQKKTYDIQESIYDTEGNLLRDKVITTVNDDQEFTPRPDKYYQDGEVTYSYKGWLSDGQTPGKDKPLEGEPPKAVSEKTYYYIYEKLDKLINVTLPTEVLFGTVNQTNKVSSASYVIKNNSSLMNIDLNLEEFMKEKSDITLLDDGDDIPTGTSNSAKLNLLVDSSPVIKGLSEKIKGENITHITPEQSIGLSINGEYFGSMEEKHIVDYKMKIKVKAGAITDER